MIYLLSTAVIMTAFYFYSADRSVEYGTVNALGSALLCFIAYVFVKGGIYRVKDKVSKQVYCGLSWCAAPIYAISIIAGSQTASHIDYSSNVLPLIFIVMVMSDFWDLNAKVLESSSTFARQKDGLLFPSIGEQWSVRSYVIRFSCAYIAVQIIYYFGLMRVVGTAWRR